MVVHPASCTCRTPTGPIYVAIRVGRMFGTRAGVSPNSPPLTKAAAILPNHDVPPPPRKK